MIEKFWQIFWEQAEEIDILYKTMMMNLRRFSVPREKQIIALYICTLWYINERKLNC